MALIKIGHHLLKTRKGDTVDIVFVIDASKSMRNDIDAVRNHLNQMTDLLESADLDFTVGLVAFRDGTSFSLLGWDFQVTAQTKSIQEIKKKLAPYIVGVAKKPSMHSSSSSSQSKVSQRCRAAIHLGHR